MDLELGPPRVNVELVDLLAQELRVLVTLLQVVGRQTDQVHLKWRLLPVSGPQLAYEFLNVIDDASREDIEDIEGVECAFDVLIFVAFPPQTFLLMLAQFLEEVH